MGRTPSVRGNCDPEWNSTFCFVVRNEHTNSNVDFTLRDDDPDARSRGISDRSLGQLSFPLARAIQSSPLVLQDESLSGIAQGTINAHLEYLPVDETRHKCKVDAP